MTALPDLLTEAEAAERLKVCARTLRKARISGQLTFVQMGRVNLAQGPRVRRDQLPQPVAARGQSSRTG